MDVFAGVEGDHRAVAAARGDHRDLAFEIDEAFEDGGRAGHRLPCGRGIGKGHDPGLAFAVVAEAAGLEDRRGADFGQRVVQCGGVLDQGVGRGREAGGPEEVFFREPVLGGLERAAAGAHGGDVRDRVDGGERHVLELVGDDVD